MHVRGGCGRSGIGEWELTIAAANVSVGGTHGNGADPVREMTHNAKGYALLSIRRCLTNLRENAFSSSTDHIEKLHLCKRCLPQEPQTPSAQPSKKQSAPWKGTPRHGKAFPDPARPT